MRLVVAATLAWLAMPALVHGKCPEPPPVMDHATSRSLHPDEQRWLRFVGENVIPRVAAYSPRRCVAPCIGDQCTSACLVALGSWWGLKEGVFDPGSNRCGTNAPVTGNPFRESCCSKRCGKRCVEETWLDPVTGVCPHRRAWQVGLAGVQVPNFKSKDLSALIAALDTTPDALLREVAALAGYAPGDPRYVAIVRSRGVVRKSWLLRHPVIGLLLVARDAGQECFAKSKAWCWGQRYATDAATADANVRALRTFFAACTPTTTTTIPSGGCPADFPVECPAGFCCPSGDMCNTSGCCGGEFTVPCGDYCCTPGSVCGQGGCTDPCPAETPVACGDPLVCCVAGSVCGRDCNVDTTTTTIPGGDCRCYCSDGRDCTGQGNSFCGVDSLGIPNVCGCPVSCP